MVRWFIRGFVCLLMVSIGVVGGYRLGTAKPEVESAVQPQAEAAEPHPFDRELAEALDGLGPSSRTAGIYYDFLDRWDAELNRVFREWMRELTPEEQNALRGAQRAWIVSRDADRKLIEAAYWPEGRTVTPTLYQSAAACRIMNLTRERVLILQHLKMMRIDILKEFSAL